MQAVAADAAWLAFAPPPPDGPGVVCLVDSGVDPNPDTTPILAGATALDPAAPTTDGTDSELAYGHPESHGTEMAMLMAAPQNGWGMVGLAPTSVRVYSVRALPEGELGFPFSSYSFALNTCRAQAQASGGHMGVISLSLGGVISPSANDLTQLANEIAAAHRDGLSVVAATGNDASAYPAVDNYPAAANGVLSVGASDATSVGLCAFSQDSASTALLAPGCNGEAGGIDAAWADTGSQAVVEGTSAATALAAAALAAMRAYSPALTFAQTEDCLTTTSTNRRIDVAAAFEACDLGNVVTEARRALAAAQTPAGSVTVQDPSVTQSPAANTPPPDPTRTGLPRPRVRQLRDRRGDVLTAINRPPTAYVVVQRRTLTHSSTSAWVTVIVARSSQLILHIHRGTPLRLRFESRPSDANSSPWFTGLSR